MDGGGKQRRDPGIGCWVRRMSILATLVAGVLMGVPAIAAAQSYTVKTLHFSVTVGPPGAEQQCNIVGDLYKPADASAAHPDPSVLTTNGFGGSKDDQAAFGKELASQGYVVLSYSGLGFGGTSCPIELDDPAYDGREASQLISFLGGGKAAADGTKIDYVVHDQTAHNGQHFADDPRVGMIGGSYGGEVQFAAAEQDPRLDTIIPIITWNDLTYSLAPNNAGLPPTVPSDSVTSATPGVAKFIWLNAFFGEGAAVDGLQQLSNDPKADLTGCPNFNGQVCSAAVQTDTTGSPPASAIALLRHASVESYMSRIRIPTLLAQGENDTLFQLHEAVSTYQSLRQQGTSVKMVWQSTSPTRARRSTSGSTTTSRAIPPPRRWTSASFARGSSTPATPPRPTVGRRATPSATSRAWTSPAPTPWSASRRPCAAARPPSRPRLPARRPATARSPPWR